MKESLMIFPLVILLCFTFGCQDKEAMAELEEFKAQKEVEDENISLVKRRYEAWNSGDVEAIKEVIINRGRKQTRSDNVGACLFGRNRV
jgi:hypothetical protein